MRMRGIVDETWANRDEGWGWFRVDGRNAFAAAAFLLSFAP
jgi:hypothetical protein